MKKIILLSILLGFLSCNKDNLNGVTGEQNSEIPDTPPTTPSQTFADVTIPSNLLYYYQGIDFDKNGIDLYNDLATLTITKHSKFLQYTERHPFLQKADASLIDKSKVVLIYSGVEASIGGNVYDTEHVYPQSLLSAENKSQSYADLHHLRYCVKADNSSRGNRAFTSGSGDKSVIGQYWYPGDDWRGDVARILLYMNLRYNEPFNKVSTNGVTLLLQWNAQDPVSEFENQRNNEIEQAQKNRNPFIDNPYLATKIWGGVEAQNLWK